MPGALSSDAKVTLPGVTDGGHDIRRRFGQGDRCGTLVDGEIPRLARRRPSRDRLG